MFRSQGSSACRKSEYIKFEYVDSTHDMYIQIILWGGGKSLANLAGRGDVLSNPLVV